MPREYRELLELSEELQGYHRYLDTAGVKQRNALRARFDTARRKFVYDLFQEQIGAEKILSSVSADLDEIDASARYGDETIAFVRDELGQHVRKQAGNNPFQRFVVRWGPPALAAIAAVAYVYVRFISA